MCWDGKKKNVIVHRITKKDGAIPRINNMITQQHVLLTDSSPVWLKQDFQQQTFPWALFTRLDNEVSTWKAKTRMRRAADEANKNWAAQARREQVDGSAVRDIRRLQVFDEKDPRLRTANRLKLYSKKKDALAIRVR